MVKQGLGVTIDRLFQETQQLLVCSGISRCSILPFHFLPIRISKKLALYTTASQQTILIISQIQELEQTAWSCFAVLSSLVRQLGETLNGRQLLPEGSRKCTQSEMVTGVTCCSVQNTNAISLSSESAIVCFVWKSFFPKGNNGLLLMQPNATFTF